MNLIVINCPCKTTMSFEVLSLEGDEFPTTFQKVLSNRMLVCMVFQRKHWKIVDIFYTLEFLDPKSLGHRSKLNTVEVEVFRFEMEIELPSPTVFIVQSINDTVGTRNGWTLINYDVPRPKGFS